MEQERNVYIQNKNKLQILSGIISEGQDSKKSDEFKALKGEMYKKGNAEQLDKIFAELDALTSEQQEIVKNKFLADSYIDDSIGNLIFKLKKNIKIFGQKSV